MSNDSKSEFIKNLKKSGVIDSDRLAEWLGVTEAESAGELAKYLIRDELLTKWQAKFLLSGRSRLQIASYQLLDRTSRDKLGDRFLAVHTSLARKVDLQVMPSELTKDESRCKPFLRKASRIAELDHPNLVHVYDIDQEGGRYFLVTEHIDGTTLDEVPRTQIAEDDVARILHQALKGVAHAHENDIVHGCIQQADLILVDKQQLKIQNLAVSPLREHSESEPNADFKAVKKIAVSLLKEIPEKKRTEKFRKLGKLLNAFDPKDPASIETTSAALSSWVGSEDHQDSDSPDDFLALGSSDPFASEGGEGGFDQPLAGSVATSVRRKKKPTKPSKSKHEDLDESVAEPGVIGKFWKNNPVGFIATAGVLALGLIGGSGFGVYSYINAAGNSSAVAKNEKEVNEPRSESKADRLESKSAPPLSNPEITDGVDVTKFTKPVLKSKLDLGPLGDRQAVPARTPVTFLSHGGGQVEIEVKLPGEKIASGWIDAKMIVDAEPTSTTGSTPPEIAPVVAAKDSASPEPKIASAARPDDETVASANKPEIETPAVVAESPVDLKDLTVINGIGPAKQKFLRAGQVQSIKQIAGMSVSEVRDALSKGGMKSANSAKPIEWIREAKELIGDSSPVKKSVASKSGAKPKPKPAVDLNAPFKSFPRLTELPPITDTNQFKIAPLKINQSYLLGAEMICEPGVSKTKLIFEMTRTQEDKQKWMVGVKRRAKEKPANIAAFKKSPDAFFFQWLPEAAENKYAEFLRNCYVKLKTPDDETTYLTLRKPIKVPDLRYFAENMINQREVVIPALPNLENIVIELLPPQVKGLDLRPGTLGIEPRQPGTIMLSRRDTNGFMWIQISGDLKSKLQLQSNVMAKYGNQVTAMSSLEDISGFIETLKQIQNQADALNAAKQKEKGPRGKSKRDKEINAQLGKEKAEFAKQAKQAKALVDKAVQYKDIVSKAANQPLHVRVYAKFGNLQTQLVETDAKLPQPKPESKKKKRKK